jgi:2-polyprenyl-3-methyl-5-hydroxy-6-metoxy-1,4-benzoquinol methylase
MEAERTVPNALKRFLQHPLNTIARVFYKLLIAPRRYAVGKDYDAERYWHDRFLKHGPALKSVGDEGLTEAEIRDVYASQANEVFSMLEHAGVRLQNSRLLEIGCGNGYYSDLLYKRGLLAYQGLDITDAFFPVLRRKFPQFDYIQGDISATCLPEKFDVVLMIDVIEHIVTQQKFAAALANVNSMLANGGLLVLAPVAARGRRSLFYVRFWTEQDVSNALPELETLEHRGRTMLLRKP